MFSIALYWMEWVIELGNVTVQLVPAHYLDSSGNFYTYDPEANILMSGDVGVTPESSRAPLFVETLDEGIVTD